VLLVAAAALVLVRVVVETAVAAAALEVGRATAVVEVDSSMRITRKSPRCSTGWRRRVFILFNFIYFIYVYIDVYIYVYGGGVSKSQGASVTY
jgi:hypothetical protein